MKSMENDDTLNNQNSLLLFSLTPQMNIDLPSSHPHHQHQHETQPSSVSAETIPATLYHHHQHQHETQPSSVSAETIPATLYHPTNPPNYGSYYGLEDQNAGFYVPASSIPVMPLKSDGSLYIMEALSRSQPQEMPLTLENMVHDQFSYYSAFRSREAPNMAEDGIHGLNNWVLAQDDHGGESGAVGSIAYGDLQPLSLSMSPSSQSSCVTSSQRTSPSVIDSVSMDTKKRGHERVDQKQIAHRKSIDSFGQRTSQYRGVTRHRWTGRYEAHLWDNSCKKEGQSRKGRQVYLGGYDMEEKAARAYDLAALKYWGPSTHINFPLENYQNELEVMKNMTRQEYVAHLRRKSSGFSRGASMYRGVTRHHQHGRWQARIGRVAGNKDLYLGTYSTQEEAAEAYDIAAIKFRGVNAVTNFDISRYDVEKIMASSNLLSAEVARRKNTEIDAANDATQTFRTESFSVASDNDNMLHQELHQCPSRNSSTEGDSHKTSFPIISELPSSAAKLNSATSNHSSWGISLPHMPVFAAWTHASFCCLDTCILPCLAHELQN